MCAWPVASRRHKHGNQHNDAAAGTMIAITRGVALGNAISRSNQQTLPIPNPQSANPQSSPSGISRLKLPIDQLPTCTKPVRNGLLVRRIGQPVAADTRLALAAERIHIHPERPLGIREACSARTRISCSRYVVVSKRLCLLIKQSRLHSSANLKVAVRTPREVCRNICLMLHGRVASSAVRETSGLHR